MAENSTPPSITETAFDCPYCGAFTTQYWLSLHAEYLGEKQRTPDIPDKDMKQKIAESGLEKERKEKIIQYCEKMDSGLVFLEQIEQGKYLNRKINNLF